MLNIRTTISRVFTLLSGAAAGQGVYFAASGYVAATYSRSDFADLGIILAIAGTCAPIISLKLDAFIPSAKSDSQLLSSKTVLSLPLLSFSIVTAIVIFLYSMGFFSFSRRGSGYFYCIAATLVGLSLAYSDIFTAFNLRSNNLRQASKQRAYQGILTSFMQVLTTLGKLSFIIVVISEICGRFMALILNAPRDLFHSAKSERFDFSVLKPAVAAAFISNLLVYFPVFLLGKIFSASDLAVYILVSRFVVMPIGLINRSVSQSFTGEYASIAREGNLIKSKHLFVKYSALSAALPALLSVLFITIASLGKMGFRLSNNEWLSDQLIYVGAWTCMVGIFQFSYSAISPALNIINLSETQLKLDILRLFIMVLGTIFLMLFGLNFYNFFAAISIVQIASYCTAYALVLSSVSKKEEKWMTRQ